MHEKTKCCGGGKKYWIVGIYAFIVFLVLLLELLHDIKRHSTWIPWIFIWICGAFLRMHLVKTEGIKDCYTARGDNCNWWCELAAATFLGPCSVCQVARQVYGYDEHSWLDGDAKWDRPDDWEYAEGVSHTPMTGLMGKNEQYDVQGHDV